VLLAVDTRLGGGQERRVLPDLNVPSPVVGYQPRILVETRIKVQAVMFLLSLSTRLLKRNGLGESRLVGG